MKQEQQKQESLTPQKIVQATIDEVYRIAIEKENYDKEAILMSYAEYGCTPAYWQKQGKWEARKQIEAYLKSSQDHPVKTLQELSPRIDGWDQLDHWFDNSEQEEEKPEEESREDNCTAEYDCQCPDCLSNRRVEVEHAQAQVVKTLEECKDKVGRESGFPLSIYLANNPDPTMRNIVAMIDKANRLFYSQFKPQSSEGLQDPK